MKKLIKLIIWVVIFGSFLEAFLRLGGAYFIWQQDRENNKYLKESSSYKMFKESTDYRILCIGDSMTAVGGENSYPNQLSRILNTNQHQKHFLVINKGTPGSIPRSVLPDIKNYLDQYAPQLVITMIGANPDPSAQTSPIILFLNKVEVYKLAKTLLSNLAEYARILPHDLFDKCGEGIFRFMSLIHCNSQNYTQLGLLYKMTYNSDLSFKSLQKALDLDPKNYQAWHIIIDEFVKAGGYENAVPCIFQFLKACPENLKTERDWAYSTLEDCYEALKKKDQLAGIYKYVIINFPHDAWGYRNLVNTFIDQEDYVTAMSLIHAEAPHVPQSIVYEQLATCFIGTGHTDSAINLLRQGIDADPTNWVLNKKLVQLLWKNHDAKGIEKVLEKYFNIGPLNLASVKPPRGLEKLDIMFGFELLSDAYAFDGKIAESDILNKRIDAFKNKDTDYYVKILKMIEQRNIPVVIVQYPLRNLKTLKDSLPQSKDYYFVDNEASFKKGVGQEGYDAYFTDDSFGDFGHCTPKGDHLLANNIANTIFEVFNLNNGN